MTRAPKARRMAAMRAAIGGASWVMPVAAGAAFGLKLGPETNAPLLLRMGGTRDLALAAGALEDTPGARARALRVGQACDLGDIAAVVLATRQGRMSKLAAVLFVAASSACLALGVAALGEADRVA